MPTLAIDVAHGDRKEVLDFAAECVRLGAIVWSGNIVTPQAAERYAKIGVNAVKIGIGPGAACTTRIVSGCGYPQAQAIRDIYSAVDIPIIADGGINSSGDIVKALALGADAVILGKLLGAAEESPALPVNVRRGAATLGGMPYPMDVRLPEGRYKLFSGMASRQQLEAAGKTVRVEGDSGLIPCTGPLEDIINNLVMGLKLGMAYVGARTIPELHRMAKFVKISPSGQRENHTRLG
jgi:IMP dehydrogenase